MNISVFGLGYVGSVSAACLAKQGHTVVGVDINPVKVEYVNTGQSPIREVGLAELIKEHHAGHRLSATTDSHQAVQCTDLSLVCVGTPSKANGSLDLTYVERVCHEIGVALRRKSGHHVVVVRSTMLPGTTEQVVIPALECGSGKCAGRDFAACVNPEFLREGTAIRDFHSPPFTLIGSDSPDVAGSVSSLYAAIDAPLLVTGVRTAEMVKYACNCFHALKISFANEMGNLCKGLGVDSYEVMRVFCQDTKLNLSPAYLSPGFAFGGSCLPKDLRAVTYKARQLDIDVPVLRAALSSNELQIRRAIDMVLGTGKRRVGVLGLAFKAGTDDLRESPIVLLVEALIGKGMQLAIYDSDLALAHLIGANREYIQQEIPHISELMKASVSEVLNHAEVLVIGSRSVDPCFIQQYLGGEHIVIDLVRLLEDRVSNGGYQGICW